MEREMKWTPEPWEATDFEVKAGIKTVADCLLGTFRQPGITPNEIKANLTLIAAAPQMYEALRAIVDWCDDPHGSDKRESLAEGLSSLLPSARLALIAAEGGTR